MAKENLGEIIGERRGGCKLKDRGRYRKSKRETVRRRVGEAGEGEGRLGSEGRENRKQKLICRRDIYILLNWCSDALCTIDLVFMILIYFLLFL